jgi:hypothetical protein
MNSRRITTLGLLAALGLGALTQVGCAGEDELVCAGAPERIAVVPFTSSSDLAIAQELTPEVAEQMAARAAETCGEIGGGLAVRNVESELVVDMAQMKPDAHKAPNRNPYVTRMEKDANAHLKSVVLDPLEKAQATGGSPFLGALAKVAAEFEAHDRRGPSVIVLVGDIIDIESSPTGRLIDFRKYHVDEKALQEFLPLLEPLRGSCVVAVGAGANSDRDPELLRHHRALLDDLLANVEIDFRATRAADVPKGCRARTLDRAMVSGDQR